MIHNAQLIKQGAEAVKCAFQLPLYTHTWRVEHRDIFFFLFEKAEDAQERQPNYFLLNLLVRHTTFPSNE